MPTVRRNVELSDEMLTGPISSARASKKQSILRLRRLSVLLLDLNKNLMKISGHKNRWKRYRLPEKLDGSKDFFAKGPGHQNTLSRWRYYGSRFGEIPRCDARDVDGRRIN